MALTSSTMQLAPKQTMQNWKKALKSRSGYSRKAGFEGGQLPLYRRLPKRGFSNANFKTEYAVLNLSDLNKFDEGTVVTPELLKETGIVKKQLSRLRQ